MFSASMHPKYGGRYNGQAGYNPRHTGMYPDYEELKRDTPGSWVRYNTYRVTHKSLEQENYNSAMSFSFNVVSIFKAKIFAQLLFSGSLEVQKLLFLIVVFLFQRFMGSTVLYLANFLNSSIIYWFIFYSTNYVQCTWTLLSAYVLYCVVSKHYELYYKCIQGVYTGDVHVDQLYSFCCFNSPCCDGTNQVIDIFNILVNIYNQLKGPVLAVVKKF